MSTILVTGASGFIGTHLCRRLVDDGHIVHGISRDAQLAEPGAALCWHRADLTDADMTRRVIETVQPEIIFHLASRVTGSRELREVGPLFKNNLASTVNILSNSAETHCRRVVLAGSSEEPVRECDAPCSPYAAAKRSSTVYARMFQSLFHVSVVVPRIFMTYGPGQQDVTKLVPYTILTMLNGESPKLSSGRRLVDWIYVDDVVRALVKAAFVDECGQLEFDLGSGSLVSIRSIIEEISQIIGESTLPAFGALPDRPMEPERVADTSYMQRKFGWKPATPLRIGLERTVEWYRKAYKTVACFLALWIATDRWTDISSMLEPLLEV